MCEHEDVNFEAFDFENEEKDKITGRGTFDTREDHIIEEDKEEDE